MRDTFGGVLLEQRKNRVWLYKDIVYGGEFIITSLQIVGNEKKNNDS